jgi:hypothetical protein
MAFLGLLPEGVVLSDRRRCSSSFPAGAPTYSSQVANLNFITSRYQLSQTQWLMI